MRGASFAGAVLVGAALAVAPATGGSAWGQQPSIECRSTDALDLAPMQIRGGDGAVLASFREAAACHHWITFYFAAESLFNAGERDEAVRWFYVGQLRGRTVASLDRDGATAMAVDALQHAVGQPLNEYAGGDLQNWIAAVDWALAWDAQHPLQRQGLKTLGPAMDFSGRGPLGLIAVNASERGFSAAYAEQRRGMARLREAIAAMDPEETRRMRRQNGLE